MARDTRCPAAALRRPYHLRATGAGRSSSHEGRPTKIEGNPAHPGSLGATDVFLEADILQLYDPDRSRTVRQRGGGGGVASWDSLLTDLLPRLTALEAQGGEGLLILT